MPQEFNCKLVYNKIDDSLTLVTDTVTGTTTNTVTFPSREYKIDTENKVNVSVVEPPVFHELIGDIVPKEMRININSEQTDLHFLYIYNFVNKNHITEEYSYNNFAFCCPTLKKKHIFL
jgi:hypothetical protein